VLPTISRMLWHRVLNFGDRHGDCPHAHVELRTRGQAGQPSRPKVVRLDFIERGIEPAVAVSTFAPHGASLYAAFPLPVVKQQRTHQTSPTGAILSIAANRT